MPYPVRDQQHQPGTRAPAGRYRAPPAQRSFAGPSINHLPAVADAHRQRAFNRTQTPRAGSRSLAARQNSAGGSSSTLAKDPKPARITINYELALFFQYVTLSGTINDKWEFDEPIQQETWFEHVLESAGYTKLDLLGIMAHDINKNYRVKNVLLALRSSFSSHNADEQQYHLPWLCDVHARRTRPGAGHAGLPRHVESRCCAGDAVEVGSGLFGLRPERSCNHACQWSWEIGGRRYA